MEITEKKGFLSDNTSGAHPAVMEALLQSNSGHAAAYGEDDYTRRMGEAFDRLFGRKVYAFPVLNGTGANVAALAHMTKRYSSVLCSDVAHIFEDECGAPEHMMGCKILGLSSINGKITPEAVEGQMGVLGSQHASQPTVLSLSQLSEKGTAYTLEELGALCAVAHDHGLYTHMDGARFANALVTLGCTPSEMSCEAGIDVLSFGGTKNGMLFGDAVLFFDEGLAKGFPFTRKNCGQLFSKGRFIAAQFIAMFEGGLWLECAGHANAMARRLAEGMKEIADITVHYPVDGNEIFVSMPEALFQRLNAAYPFTFHGEYRLVTSFDTAEEEVDGFLALAREGV